MAKFYKASKIAELALQRIGAFSVNDTAPDPIEMERALYWMDMAVAEVVETNRCWWLVPVTIVKALTANTVSYDLSDFLGSSYPSDGILFPVSAFLRDSSSHDEPVEIIRREEYEAISKKTESGTTSRIFIDRVTDDQNLYVHPQVTATGYSLGLIAQVYSPSVLAGAKIDGNLAHGFSAGWQRFLVLATAAEIGSGPVRRLPLQEVADIRGQAGASLANLFGYANREKVSEPRRTAAWGEDYGDSTGVNDYGEIR